MALEEHRGAGKLGNNGKEGAGNTGFSNSKHEGHSSSRAGGQVSSGKQDAPLSNNGNRSANIFITPSLGYSSFNTSNISSSLTSSASGGDGGRGVSSGALPSGG